MYKYYSGGTVKIYIFVLNLLAAQICNPICVHKFVGLFPLSLGSHAKVEGHMPR
jgi:hypothetical protein